MFLPRILSLVFALWPRLCFYLVLIYHNVYCKSIDSGIVNWRMFPLWRQKLKFLKQTSKEQKNAIFSQHFPYTIFPTSSKGENSKREDKMQIIDIWCEPVWCYFYVDCYWHFKLTQQFYLLLLGWSGPTNWPCSSRKRSGLNFHGSSQKSGSWLNSQILGQIC